MTFSGSQRVESGVLAHALDGMIEHALSFTTSIILSISHHLEQHQLSITRQTSPTINSIP
jgi:hypothetical protein